MIKLEVKRIKIRSGKKIKLTLTKPGTSMIQVMHPHQN
jgi:hypothetical protein